MNNMKKSSFVAMVLGTVSGVMFALGMCMALLPEWNAFKEGIVLGAVGLVMGLVTVIVWRKMENKQPVRLNPRNVLFVVLGVVGALTLGLGMCFCMVWDKLLVGVPVGLAGILLLLGLIPLCKGLQ